MSKKICTQTIGCHQAEVMRELDYTVEYLCGYVAVSDGVTTKYYTDIISSTDGPIYVLSSELYADTYTNLTLDVAAAIEAFGCGASAPIDRIGEIDPEVVCLQNNTTGEIVTGWEVFNISMPVPTSNLYVGGVDVTGSYTVVSCPSSKYDYEEKEICVNGEMWIKVNVYDTSSSSPALLTTLFLDTTNTPVPQPTSYTVGPCPSAICTPMISDAYGDDLSTLLPGTNFTITKPDCCRIRVNTSAGSFTLREKETYFSSVEFKCPVTISSVEIISGNCTTSNIHLITSTNG